MNNKWRFKIKKGESRIHPTGMRLVVMEMLVGWSLFSSLVAVMK